MVMLACKRQCHGQFTMKPWGIWFRFAAYFLCYFRLTVRLSESRSDTLELQLNNSFAVIFPNSPFNRTYYPNLKYVFEWVLLKIDTWWSWFCKIIFDYNLIHTCSKRRHTHLTSNATFVYRSDDKKQMESETNSVDRAVANLMFNGTAYCECWTN